MLKRIFPTTATLIRRTYGSFSPLTDFSKVIMPPLENRLLPILDAAPIFPQDQKPYKYPKRVGDIRGPEPIHNSLMFGQFGIIALTDNKLKIEHINQLRTYINSKLNTKKMFACWRIDAPWKSKVKRGVSRRLGGGKANIHHYVTPVKAGRVILEIGGYIEFDEVYNFLSGAAYRLPCFAMPISAESIEKLREIEQEMRSQNINPVTRARVFKNNMQGCHRILDYYEVQWEGKYV